MGWASELVGHRRDDEQFGVALGVLVGVGSGVGSGLGIRFGGFAPGCRDGLSAQDEVRRGQGDERRVREADDEHLARRYGDSHHTVEWQASRATVGTKEFPSNAGSAGLGATEMFSVVWECEALMSECNHSRAPRAMHARHGGKPPAQYIYSFLVPAVTVPLGMTSCPLGTVKL